MFKVRLPGGRHSVTLDEGTTLVADARGISQVAEHLLQKAYQVGCSLVEEAETAVHLKSRPAPAPAPPPAPPPDPPAVVKGQRKDADGAPPVVETKEADSAAGKPDDGAGDGGSEPPN